MSRGSLTDMKNWRRSPLFLIMTEITSVFTLVFTSVFTFIFTFVLTSVFKLIVVTHCLSLIRFKQTSSFSKHFRQTSSSRDLFDYVFSLRGRQNFHSVLWIFWKIKNSTDVFMKKRETIFIFMNFCFGRSGVFSTLTGCWSRRNYYSLN